jgi:hypothetical protein
MTQVQYQEGLMTSKEFDASNLIDGSSLCFARSYVNGAPDLTG